MAKIAGFDPGERDNFENIFIGIRYEYPFNRYRRYKYKVWHF